MRYRQPFHEKLENIVEGDRSDDAGGWGQGVGRARGRVRAGAQAQACGRVRVRVRVRASSGMPVATVTYNLCSSMPSDFT